MKCGICQKNKIPNRIQPSAETPLSAADQPIKGGNAPAIAPISVLHVDQRLAGVYQPRYEMIVRSVNIAARGCAFAKSRKSEATHISAPSTKAEPVATLPVGIGRSAVRFIWAS